MRLNPSSSGEGPWAAVIAPFSLVVVVQAVAVLPVFLLGGLATLVRGELGFDQRGIGAAVAAFFAVSATASAPAGRWGQHIGALTAMRLGVVGSALALSGIAALARSWPALVAFLVLAGMANALIQPATNLYLSTDVATTRQGLAFGVKQSSIPLATLLGGGAVPVIGVTIGWRWAYVGACAVAAALVMAIPRRSRSSVVRPPSRSDYADTATGRIGGISRRHFVLLALAAGCSAAGANAMAAYFVEYLVTTGAREAVAGSLLSLGSIAAIAVRVGFGWRTDVRRVKHLLPYTAVLLVSGAIGYALLAVAGSWWAIVPGALLAFGGGWGWSGLFVLAVVRHSAGAAAAATGITQAGVYLGAVVGPLSFGSVAVAWSFDVAWSAAALLTVFAAGLVLAAHRSLGRAADAVPLPDAKRREREPGS